MNTIETQMNWNSFALVVAALLLFIALILAILLCYEI